MGQAGYIQEYIWIQKCVHASIIINEKRGNGLEGEQGGGERRGQKEERDGKMYLNYISKINRLNSQ